MLYLPAVFFLCPRSPTFWIPLLVSFPTSEAPSLFFFYRLVTDPLLYSQTPTQHHMRGRQVSFGPVADEQRQSRPLLTAVLMNS